MMFQEFRNRRPNFNRLEMIDMIETPEGGFVSVTESGEPSEKSFIYGTGGESFNGSFFNTWFHNSEKSKNQVIDNDDHMDAFGRDIGSLFN